MRKHQVTIFFAAYVVGRKRHDPFQVRSILRCPVNSLHIAEADIRKKFVAFMRDFLERSSSLCRERKRMPRIANHHRLSAWRTRKTRRCREAELRSAFPRKGRLKLPNPKRINLRVNA